MNNVEHAYFYSITNLIELCNLCMVPSHIHLVYLCDSVIVIECQFLLLIKPYYL